MTEQTDLTQLDSRRIPETSEHTCLQLPSQETILVFASEAKKTASITTRRTLHQALKAPALRRIRQQSAGSKAPRGQRALKQRTANLHRVDNLIVAALAWLRRWCGWHVTPDASISLGALELKLTTSVLQLRQHFLASRYSIGALKKLDPLYRERFTARFSRASRRLTEVLTPPLTRTAFQLCEAVPSENRSGCAPCKLQRDQSQCRGRSNNPQASAMTRRRLHPGHSL